jgi:two-component system response regulator ChvI
MEGSTELVPDATAPAQPLNVLFVDDDEMFREVMSTNLADEGVTARVFETGQALLDFVVNHGTAGYDALLLDLKMPGIDGIGVLRRLRAAGVRLPAVFLTLYNEEAHEQAALEGGAVDFVDKTRNVGILATRLRIIAQGAKAQLEPEPEPVVIGDLTLNTGSARALWKGAPVALTVTQFRIVQLLATRSGQDISYREI